jgi:hypothetical protein
MPSIEKGIRSEEMDLVDSLPPEWRKLVHDYDLADLEDAIQLFGLDFDLCKEHLEDTFGTPPTVRQRHGRRSCR